ncbi:MAG TPA: DUF3800 domain-containing protein [Candidatus Didemnitutus sp.]|nr:DUF3800 domain-containing protein [Candidatus Didemnitutus sp.]
MKFCYCDESGTGEEPIAVMVGVIVDAQRMHVTKEEWRELLGSLSRVIGREVTELHTRDFYSGNGIWRELRGTQRAETISSVLDWLVSRRHDVVYAAVNKEHFRRSLESGKIPREVNTPWRFLGLHLLLAVQKVHEKHSKNKGHTIFVFDNEEREKMKLSDLVRNAPSWTDTFYSKGKKQERLDQIVDVPYFADSEAVYLLQLADFLAYFLRRHAEIESRHSGERYDGESDRLSGWIEKIMSRSIGGSAIYPATGRCSCAELFYAHAPNVIRTMHRA